MNQCEQALQWAEQYLTSDKNNNIVNSQQIIQTAYSIVHKIETTEGIVYLKQTPKELFLEPKTLIFLNKIGCRNIPEFLAMSATLDCFLMRSCGDESLRHLFNGQLNLNQLKKGITNYTHIQRSLENKVQQMLSIGIPDWRLDKFSLLYSQLIHQDKLLIEDGLTLKEIDQLHQSYSTCILLCERLAEFRLPETINHCDFHENNMLLDNKTGDISIIDWGEAVITHPFLSLCGCLWNLRYFNELIEADTKYSQLQSFCVSSWLDLYNEEKLIKALNTANQLNGIYAALAYERMYMATKDQLQTVQQDHSGSIAGCLRTFLSTIHS
jgi:hypothetical protein